MPNKMCEFVVVSKQTFNSASHYRRKKQRNFFFFLSCNEYEYHSVQIKLSSTRIITLTNKSQCLGLRQHPHFLTATVWCALSSAEILVSVLTTESAISNVYFSLPTDESFPFLVSYGIARNISWAQQNAVRPHTRKAINFTRPKPL